MTKITSLKQLAEASLQDILNQSGNHLLRQGARCQDGTDSFSSCTWRSGNMRCAVGVFMSDGEIQDANNEDLNSPNDLDDYFNLDLPSDHLMLLDDLVEVHDEEDVEYWGECLAQLANQYNLTFTRQN